MGEAALAGGRDRGVLDHDCGKRILRRAGGRRRSLRQDGRSRGLSGKTLRRARVGDCSLGGGDDAAAIAYGRSIRLARSAYRRTGVGAAVCAGGNSGFCNGRDASGCGAGVARNRCGGSQQRRPVVRGEHDGRNCRGARGDLRVAAVARRARNGDGGRAVEPGCWRCGVGTIPEQGRGRDHGREAREGKACGDYPEPCAGAVCGGGRHRAWLRGGVVAGDRSVCEHARVRIFDCAGGVSCGAGDRGLAWRAVCAESARWMGRLRTADRRRGSGSDAGVRGAGAMAGDAAGVGRQCSAIGDGEPGAEDVCKLCGGRPGNRVRADATAGRGISDGAAA